MPQLRYLHDQDPWMLAEDIPDIDFHFSQIWLSSFVNDLRRTVQRNYRKVLCVYHGYNLKFYYGQQDSTDFSAHVFSLIQRRPAFGQRINREIRRWSDRLKTFSKRELTKGKLASRTNAQFAKLCQQLDELHTALYSWGWLPNVVDMFHENFTSYLKGVLAVRLPSNQVNQALMALNVTLEPSILQQEHTSFLKLAEIKQKRCTSKGFENALRHHRSRYFHLKHLWIGKEGVYDEQHYRQEVERFIASGENAAELLQKDRTVLRGSLGKRAKLLHQLRLNSHDAALFDVYAEFAVTKLYRRDAQVLWAYQMDSLFAELAKRLHLTVMQVRFMQPNEITHSLRQGRVTLALRHQLQVRTRYCAYYAEEDADRIFTGLEARRLEVTISQESLGEITELSGQTACLGRAKGRVKVINSVTEMGKMEPGDILVSIATNPDIVPAMKKAAAIVTEQGGITSHAAIVSREMNTPCVIGTKIATQALHDGDLVDVDADQGIVRVLERAAQSK